MGRLPYSNILHVCLFISLYTSLWFTYLPHLGFVAAVMANAAIGAHEWYAKVLLLKDHGAVPGQTNGGIKATKKDCVEAYSSPNRSGRYSFLYRGSLEYCKYV